MTIESHSLLFRRPMRNSPSRMLSRTLSGEAALTPAPQTPSRTSARFGVRKLVGCATKHVGQSLLAEGAVIHREPWRE